MSTTNNASKGRGKVHAKASSAVQSINDSMKNVALSSSTQGHQNSLKNTMTPSKNGRHSPVPLTAKAKTSVKNTLKVS